MSVADLLGLDGDDNGLLQAARGRWSEWTMMEPRLAAVEGLDHLLQWRREADPDAVDEVLLGLAMLAAPDGGNDEAAATALAKVMLPAACNTAGRLSGLPLGQVFRDNQPVDKAQWARRVDEIVASQLWIEVRSFPWRKQTSVAGYIRTRVRNGVLREVGDPYRAGRGDTTWARTTLVGAFSHGDVPEGPGRPDDQRFGPVRASGALCGHPGILADTTAPAPDELPLTPAEELLEVLTWACEEQVITDEDRRLLMCLVQEADQVPVRNKTRGRGGLLSNEVSARVARRVGVSAATVRRRGSRSMAALAAAVPDGFAA